MKIAHNQRILMKIQSNYTMSLLITNDNDRQVNETARKSSPPLTSDHAVRGVMDESMFFRKLPRLLKTTPTKKQMYSELPQTSKLPTWTTQKYSKLRSLVTRTSKLDRFGFFFTTTSPAYVPHGRMAAAPASVWLEGQLDLVLVVLVCICLFRLTGLIRWDLT